MIDKEEREKIFQKIVDNKEELDLSDKDVQSELVIEFMTALIEEDEDIILDSVEGMVIDWSPVKESMQEELEDRVEEYQDHIGDVVLQLAVSQKMKGMMELLGYR